MNRYLSSVDHKSFGSEFLDSILDWAEENLRPEEVFPETVLRDWARDVEPLEIYSEDALREALGIEEPTDATE